MQMLARLSALRSAFNADMDHVERMVQESQQRRNGHVAQNGNLIDHLKREIEILQDEYKGLETNTGKMRSNQPVLSPPTHIQDDDDAVRSQMDQLAELQKRLIEMQKDMELGVITKRFEENLRSRAFTRYLSTTVILALLGVIFVFFPRLHLDTY
eukprot:TRINITY_DN4116_c0_g1_i2.p1 TRINITY_DN4116_c0_g1~~TRINITY_DN4116_c0_g1_i2.p1  ORF type:complete len:155 (+),score=10.04 TRINITY_DN4116_c0_g1_i2:294-758(+)